MKYRYYRFISWPVFACAVVAAALGLLMLGPFMRESDQAWLLDGGMAIAKGHPAIARGEFNFDKQFVSYYLIGGLDRLLPRPYQADTLVFAGNVLGFVLFWGALLLLLARSARRLMLPVFLPLLLTPAFLDYSAFYGSAFTSAAFLFLLAVHLDRRSWGVISRLGIFVLSFLAVGARADALLALPLLAVLHSREKNFACVFFSVNTWLSAAGGLAAFILGRILYLTVSVDGALHAVPFKQFAAHLVFGLGATALLLAVALFALWRMRGAGRRQLWMFFVGLGLALPMLFYGLQLLSPRHCTLAAAALAVFICARTGRAVFICLFRARLSGLIKLALPAAALLPIFVGVDISQLHHPKLTFLRPTLLPSVAGVAPAGAQLGFAISVKQLNGILDHNHAIWSAARDTRFRPDAEGSVPYLYSPIEAYFKFAIRLQNEIPRRFNLENAPQIPAAFYCESRVLMRMQYYWEPELMTYFFSQYSLAPTVRSRPHGLTIMRAQANAQPIADDFSGALWALNQSFGPDEFRLEELAPLKKIPADWSGKRIVLATHDKLRVETKLEKTSWLRAGQAVGTWHVVELEPARPGESIGLPMTGEKIYVGVSAYPAWMTLKK